jgi:hypothetical protein
MRVTSGSGRLARRSWTSARGHAGRGRLMRGPPPPPPLPGLLKRICSKLACREVIGRGHRTVIIMSAHSHPHSRGLRGLR